MVTRRIRIAELMESVINKKDWKGEKEACGIWFTDERGYILNRILAIEVKHIESAPDVFYSFYANIDEKVTIHYPFNRLSDTPKKHHVLHSQVEPEVLSKVFELKTILAEGSFAPLELMDFINSSILNKKSMNAAVCIWHLEQDKWELKKEHRNPEKQIVYGEKIIESNWVSKKNIQLVKLSASTFISVLSIFDQKTHIKFSIARDRMKITGATSSGNEVNIVLAMMK